MTSIYFTVLKHVKSKHGNILCVYMCTGVYTHVSCKYEGQCINVLILTNVEHTLFFKRLSFTEFREYAHHLVSSSPGMMSAYHNDWQVFVVLFYLYFNVDAWDPNSYAHTCTLNSLLSKAITPGPIIYV